MLFIRSYQAASPTLQAERPIATGVCVRVCVCACVCDLGTPVCGQNGSTDRDVVLRTDLRGMSEPLYEVHIGAAFDPCIGDAKLCHVYFDHLLKSVHFDRIICDKRRLYLRIVYVLLNNCYFQVGARKRGR